MMVKVPAKQDMVLEIQKLVSYRVYNTLMKNNGFLAGGSLLNLLFNIGEIKDLDIYFPTKIEYEQSSAYLDKLYDYWWSSSNAKTYNPDHYRRNDLVKTMKPLQLISLRFGKPTDVLRTFDLDVCKFGYCFSNNCVYYDRDSMFSVEDMKVRVCHYELPIDTLFRICKYMLKGFKPDYMDIVRLGIVISTIPAEEINLSMDSNYFTNSGSLKDALKLYPDLLKKMNNFGPYSKEVIGRLSNRLLEECS